MESIAPMIKSQMIAFIFRTEMGLFALQIFFEGSDTLICTLRDCCTCPTPLCFGDCCACQIDRGLGIMFLEISGTFLLRFQRSQQKRIPLCLLADFTAPKVSGPSLDGVDADRTLRHCSFAFSGFSSAGRIFVEVHSQRIR